MSIYKITNITNTFVKRNIKYNSVLDIYYVENLTKKKIILNPGDTIYLEVSQLPLSVQKFNVMGLITVAEVTSKEVANAMSLKNKRENLIIEQPKQDTDDSQKGQKKRKLPKIDD